MNSKIQVSVPVGVLVAVAVDVPALIHRAARLPGQTGCLAARLGVRHVL